MGTPFPVANAEPLSQAARSIEEVHKQIIEMRNQKAPEYVAPPVPVGIAEKTRLELEEGKRQNARQAAERANALVPKPDKSEGTTEPVYRPADYVPNMNQGQTVTKSYKTL
jgi:hypothetical protein